MPPSRRALHVPRWRCPLCAERARETIVVLVPETGKKREKETEAEERGIPSPDLSRGDFDAILLHLRIQHALLVAEPDELFSSGRAPEYFHGWRETFREFGAKSAAKTASGESERATLQEYCTTLRAGPKGDTEFFLLGPIHPRDAQLRAVREQGVPGGGGASSDVVSRLRRVLDHQARERDSAEFREYFSARPCLFCRKPVSQITAANSPKSESSESGEAVSSGTALRPREAYFAHLWDVHHVSVGNVNNLVFTREFLELLDARLQEKVRATETRSFPQCDSSAILLLRRFPDGYLTKLFFSVLFAKKLFFATTALPVLRRSVSGSQDALRPHAKEEAHAAEPDGDRARQVLRVVVCRGGADVARPTGCPPGNFDSNFDCDFNFSFNFHFGCC
jgi:hypothetical protein